MAVTTVTLPGYPTIAEVATRMDPQGGIAAVAEVLKQKWDVLDDLPWVEGNLPTGHRITLRSQLPTPTWRRYNEGVTPSVSRTTQADEVCGLMELHSKVDCELANLNGNAAAFRASEDKAFVQGMTKELATTLFYGNLRTDPTKFHGLANRWWNRDASVSTGPYTITIGTTLSGVNCRSIWLIRWDPETLHMIYPKGSTGGLSMKDLGLQLVNDDAPTSGTWQKQFLAYVSQWVWRCGLCARDYRYAVRAQVDEDDTSGAWVTTSKALFLGLQTMLNTIQDTNGMLRFYMDRTVKNMLDAQLANASANFLEYIDAGGKRIPAFQGVPIRIVDSLVQENLTANYAV